MRLALQVTGNASFIFSSARRAPAAIESSEKRITKIEFLFSERFTKWKVYNHVSIMFIDCDWAFDACAVASGDGDGRLFGCTFDLR